MRGRGLLWAVVLLALCGGCGRREDAAASAAEASGEYWTVETGKGAVSLRSGGADQLHLVLGRDGEEDVLLRTLRRDEDYHDPQNLTAWAFRDIMDWEGFALRTGVLGDWFGTNVYYAIEDSTAVPIAESFGFAVEDYAVDLDGDGVTELVANNTYGGDGHRTASVFQRREDGVWRGGVVLPDLPGHDGGGANSYWTEYDPGAGLFRITYSVKDQEAPGVLETAGLEWFEFAPYVYKGEEGGGIDESSN